jgi:Flp pilus assembly protein TadG
MIGKFLRDRRGNFALMTAIAMVPIMGALALAIDYTEVTRQKQATLNSLDAAGIATARYLVTGANNEAVVTYAKNFLRPISVRSTRRTPRSASRCPPARSGAPHSSFLRC